MGQMDMRPSAKPLGEMQVVLLAGGRGTRLAEETLMRPKPMVGIGSMPILWHIMKFYGAFGVKRFLILAGYKSHMIKEFFVNYRTNFANVRVHLTEGSVTMDSLPDEDWDVRILDTGIDSMTGGRLLRAAAFLDEEFLLTYGDGLANVDLHGLLAQHRAQKSIVTLTAVRPPSRFGVLEFDADDPQLLRGFHEKPAEGETYVNGGFFAMDRRLLDDISGDETVLEQAPLSNLARIGKVSAYRHDGFWHPMDTIRDTEYLNELWASGSAPWKNW